MNHDKETVLPHLRVALALLTGDDVTIDYTMGTPPDNCNAGMWNVISNSIFHFAGLVVNYGISNTIMLEIP